MKPSTSLTIIFTAYFIAGCAENRIERPSVASVAKSAAELIDAAPKSIIDLDEPAGEILTPRLVIGGDSLGSDDGASGGLLLGQAVSTIVLGDSVYICDVLQNAIVVADRAGHLVRKIGRAGQGPLEFIEPSHIARSDRLVVVYDQGNSRVQVLDTAFRYISSISAAPFSHFTSIACSADHIFIHGDPVDSTLIKVYRPHPPFALERSFLPSVIPPGQQPMAMNKVQFAVNKEGELCVGYSSLPYLFVFGPSGQQTATIQFKGEVVEDLDAPLPGGKTSSNSAMAVRYFINGLLVLEDGKIVIAIRSSLYMLEPGSRGYTLSHRFDLRYFTPSLENSEGRIMIWHLFSDDKDIYVSSFFQPWVLVYDITHDNVQINQTHKEAL